MILAHKIATRALVIAQLNKCDAARIPQRLRINQMSHFAVAARLVQVAGVAQDIAQKVVRIGVVRMPVDQVLRLLI